MAHYKMLDGNGAAVEAIRMAKVKVVSAYPITPQSTITGIRCATATASVGLALMHEVLNVVSGCRVPIVMPVVNRSLASPWSLWCDHQDSMAERDSGWIQLYCENVQDIYDTMIMAYRIAEDQRVLTPAMVCLDGFFLSHSMQKLVVPEQEEVDAFVGEYCRKNMYLDPEDPLVIDNLTGSNEITEMKYQQARGFVNAEGYNMEDAEAVIVCMGSMAGTAKYISDKLRAQGRKVGVVKVVSFRPFPYRKLRSVIGDIKKVAVLDRTTGFGGQGTPLWTETKSALPGDCLVKNYIGGLAGRDISLDTITRVYEDILAGELSEEPVWIDCDTEHAMGIREVRKA